VTALDALLLLMVLIWGSNYTIVKSALSQIDPQAFNALRMIEASSIMLVVMAVARRIRWNPSQVFYTDARVTPREWLAMALLGAIGHCLYQYWFIGGMALTSVANASLLLSASPVVITIISALTGERVSRAHWIGVVVSLAGIYLVVGGGARLAGESWHGDLLMAGSVVCWAIYTLGARPLMQRHSPVGVTAISMVCGTLLYVPVAAPSLARLDWTSVGAGAWAALLYSGAISVCVAYVIWYAAVRALGSARTSAYSNLLPIVAMLTALVWLGEPIGAMKLAGAAVILTGVALTRVGSSVKSSSA
jgi:drug/metabolite transporter (DMT)-like permease